MPPEPGEITDAAVDRLRLAKLLKLDKRDIDAVRGFLPGKVLGRTAALLLLILIVSGYVGAVDRMLEGRLSIRLDAQPWLRRLLIFALPMLAVTTQIALEWIADRQRRRMQALAVQPSEVPHGYFRIGPYSSTEETGHNSNELIRHTGRRSTGSNVLPVCRCT